MTLPPSFVRLATRSSKPFLKVVVFTCPLFLQLRVPLKLAQSPTSMTLGQGQMKWNSLLITPLQVTALTESWH